MAAHDDPVCEIDAEAETLVPRSISDTASAGNGLPDFLALLKAEMAAAGADPERPRPSSLGAGEIVLAARELVGLSQRRLAAMIGSSQSSLATIECGKRLPTVRTLLRVADASGVEIVVGLRRVGGSAPIVLGALRSGDDGLADFLPMVSLSPFEGPTAR